MLDGYTDSDIWEGKFIEILFENSCVKNRILGNIYRPPHDNNANYQQFINELTPLLITLGNRNSDVIIAGDYNIDLLKINDKPMFSDYFDAITSLSFFPKITLPTRFTDTNCTLIDNFICKLSNRISQSTAGILISQISDHLPYFISLDNVNVSSNNSFPKYVQIKRRRAQDIANFRDEIANANICNKLDLSSVADSNKNYDILQQTIMLAINKHFPTKTVKYNKHKQKKSYWITKALINSIKYRDKLYNELKKTNPNTERYRKTKINLRTYNKILKRIIKFAKVNHFHTRFNNCKDNIKHTWSIIKEIMSHGVKASFPESFNANGKSIKDNQTIADEFNIYLSNIGKKLANDIQDNNVTFDQQ